MTVTPAGWARPVLREVSFELAGGTVVGLAGCSGAGKSTLLHVVSGLVPWQRPARVRGEVLVGGEVVDDLDPGQRARLVGTVPDRPEAQLFLPTPRVELEAAARLYGRVEVPGRLVEALGIGSLLDRRTLELSSGERQRVALAVGLTAAPRPVLLDEPSAHLDSGGVRAAGTVLGELAREGGSVLLAEQAGWRLGSAVGRWLELEDGSLHDGGLPRPPEIPPPPAAPEREIVLEGVGLRIERGGRVLLDRGSLAIRRGEVVALTGPNGAGKSLLARVLAGATRADGGRVRRRGRVALMLPESALHCLEDTVAAEAASTGAPPEVVARVLRLHGLEALAARAPWSLSRGEARRLVHAVLDLTRPAVMIVDEPAQGLDAGNLRTFVELIHRRAARGRAYLIVTHREAVVRAAHRRLVLRDGRLREEA